MATDKTKNNTAGKRQPNTKRRNGKRSKARVIKELLEAALEQVKGKQAKATLSDVIRLLQMQQESEEKEQPREIVVRWVETVSRTEK